MRLPEQAGRAAGTNALEIRSRNSRVAALQTRWDRLRAGLDLVLDQRGADMADLPGGDSELMVRDYKGKEADTLVYKVDTGLRGNGCARRSWLANEREPGP